MIYLIEDRDYVKIGFTTDLKNRMVSYRTTNCYAKLISYKPGTKIDESNLHQLCSKWHYEREWFHNVPEIRNIWNNYQSDIINQLNYIKESNNNVINFMYDNYDSFFSIPTTKWKNLLINFGTYNNRQTIKRTIDEIEDVEVQTELSKQYKIQMQLQNLYDWFYHERLEYHADFGKVKIDITFTENDNTIISTKKLSRIIN